MTEPAVVRIYNYRHGDDWVATGRAGYDCACPPQQCREARPHTRGP